MQMQLFYRLIRHSSGATMTLFSRDADSTTDCNNDDKDIHDKEVNSTSSMVFDATKQRLDKNKMGKWASNMNSIRVDVRNSVKIIYNLDKQRVLWIEENPPLQKIPEFFVEEELQRRKNLLGWRLEN